MRCDIVEIDGYYAVRRAYRKFGLFPTCDFLDLGSSVPEWESRDYKYFGRCLTKDLQKAQLMLANFGSNIGTVVGGGIISQVELFNMHEIAKTDEGMQDMLLKTKEYYILKKK